MSATASARAERRRSTSSSTPSSDSCARGSGLSAAEVDVRPVEPVGARRAEDVEVERGFEGFGSVREVRRDVEDFAGVHVDDLRLVVAEPEPQNALEDVGQLLVVML